MDNNNIESIFSLTTIQKGLLFHSLKDEEEGAYIGRHCIYLRGDIDEKAFEKSIDILNKKYDIFRTRIVYSGLENPVQLVLKNDKTKFFYSDGISVEDYIESDAKKGFVFEKENMIRVALIKISQNEYCNIWSFHHILIDGYSIAILAKDFFEIYGKIKNGEAVNVLPAPSYKKFVAWLKGQNMSGGKEYWENYIKGVKSGCAVPGDLNGEGFKAGEYGFLTDKNTSEKLKEYSRKNAASVNGVFQTVWGALLSAYNNSCDVVFGNVMAVRPPQMQDADKIAGMFSGTYPVRIQAADTDGFLDAAKKASADFINAMQYSYCSLADISGGARVINSLYVFENFDLQPLYEGAKNAGAEIYDIKMNDHSNYDFSLSIAEKKDGFFVTLRYNSCKYSAECIDKIKSDFLSALMKAATCENISFGEIKNGLLYNPILIKEEKNKEIEEANCEAPKTKTQILLTEIFEEVLNTKVYDIKSDFFELGGDSISGMRLVALCRKKGADINLKELFYAPTIKQLAEIADEKQNNHTCEITQYEADTENMYEPFPLNDIQRAYLMGINGEFELGGFTTQYYTEIEGDYDIDRLETAINKVIAHQPALRTVVNDYSSQRILRELPHYKIEVCDVSKEADGEKIIEEYREKMKTSVFDKAKLPYFTIKAFKTGEKQYRICFLIECICIDGAGLGMMLSELLEYYKNPEINLDEIKFTFKDYQKALLEEQKKEKYLKDKEFWLEKAESMPLSPEIALKGNPTAIKNPRFLRKEHFFAKEEYSALQEYCRKNKITTAALLCTAYMQTLAFWSGGDGFCVNMTVFERNMYHKDVERLVGDFTKLIAVDTQNECEDLLSQTKIIGKKIAAALEHSDYNCVNLIKEIAYKRKLGTKAVLPYVFTCALSDNGTMGFNQVYAISRTPQVYLDCQVTNRDGGLFVNWDYPEGLYDEEMLFKMFEQYVWLIAHAGENPKALIDKETQKFLEEYNSSFMEESARKERLSHTLCDLFVPSFEKYGDNIAVLDSEKQWDYKTLGENVYKVAARLKKDGVKHGDCVGITGERKAETVAAVLATLLCGAAYVPINEEYPADRVAYIMEKINATVKTDSVYVKNAIKSEEADVFESDAKPTELAYIIFTSGTTGKPKGVAIDHKGAVNTVLDINEKCEISQNDVFICLAEFGFDLSVYDLFGSLSCGAKLCIVQNQRNPEEILSVMEKQKVTFWNSVPAVMQMITGVVEDNFINKTLKNVYLSGDWIALNLPDKIREHFVNARVTSLGGATEASIWSIYYPTEKKAEISSVPYGMPLKNQSIHILNKWQKDCPIGVRGEICIGGDGVAMGYFKDEEKTNASFVNHSKYGRIYKTGDYGKMHKDGFVEFLGRIDGQVKLRGYRIELGEIENCALEYGCVKRAVAVVKTLGGSEGIVLYVESKGDFDEKGLKEYLCSKLPDYMAPAIIEKTEKIPVTANGKIDRKRLCAMKSENKNNVRTSPLNETEYEIGGVLARVSGMEEIDYEGSFFEMGIDSLKAVVIINELKKLGYSVGLTDIYTCASIAALAEEVLEKQEKYDDDNEQFEDGEF